MSAAAVACLESLLQRLDNEYTRTASLAALLRISNVSRLAPLVGKQFPAFLDRLLGYLKLRSRIVQQLSLDLILQGVNIGEKGLSAQVLKNLLPSLIPLLSSNDLSLCSRALQVIDLYLYLDR